MHRLYQTTNPSLQAQTASHLSNLSLGDVLEYLSNEVIQGQEQHKDNPHTTDGRGTAGLGAGGAQGLPGLFLNIIKLECSSSRKAMILCEWVLPLAP